MIVNVAIPVNAKSTAIGNMHIVFAHEEGDWPFTACGASLHRFRPYGLSDKVPEQYSHVQPCKRCQARLQEMLKALGIEAEAA